MSSQEQKVVKSQCLMSVDTTEHTHSQRGVGGAKEWHCPVAPCMLLAPGGFLVPLQLLSVEQEEEEEMMVNTVDSLSMESESSSVQYPPNERRGIQGHKEDVFAPDLAAVPLPQCSPLPCPTPRLALFDAFTNTHSI